MEDSERLRDVERKLDRLLLEMGGLAEKFKDYEDEQKAFRVSVHESLYGPSGSPEQGLMVRVDRLEQSQTKRDRLMWVVAAGIVYSIIAGIM